MSILNYILIGVITSAITELGYSISKNKNKKPVNWFDRIIIVLAWPIAAIILLLGILIGKKEK